jgi:hypothetical protein
MLVRIINCTRCMVHTLTPVVYREGGVKPRPQNSKVFTKLSQILSSVENTSITTQQEYGFCSSAKRAEPLTRGKPTPDPVLSALCPQLNLLNPYLQKKFLGTPLIKTVLTNYTHFIYTSFS